MSYVLNGLGTKPLAEVLSALATVPTEVTALDLSGNNFCRQLGTWIPTIFEAIPSSITVLDLGENNLGSVFTGILIASFAKIRPSVITFDLGCNNFANKSGVELGAVLAKIPVGVQTLGLSENDLYRKPGVELATALAQIPSHVTYLDLRWNDFYRTPGGELAKAFAAIPPTVTALDLSGNNLGSKPVAELIEAFAAIPATVTSLDLSGNNFSALSTADLKALFAVLPAGLASVNFHEDNSEDTSVSEFVAALVRPESPEVDAEPQAIGVGIVPADQGRAIVDLRTDELHHRVVVDTPPTALAPTNTASNRPITSGIREASSSFTINCFVEIAPLLGAALLDAIILWLQPPFLVNEVGLTTAVGTVSFVGAALTLHGLFRRPPVTSHPNEQTPTQLRPAVQKFE